MRRLWRLSSAVRTGVVRGRRTQEERGREERGWQERGWEERGWEAPLVLVTASEDRLSVGSTQGAGSVAVGREFLLQALDAAGESPTLRLDGPISPLVIRRDDQTFSLLMPTRIG